MIDCDAVSFDDELDRALKESESVRAWWKRPWLWIGVAILLIGGGYLLFSDGENGSSSAADGAPVTTTVGFRSIADVVAASGRLRPIQVVEVGAQVSGQLKKLHVRAGDTVSQGDVVAEIDATIQMNVVTAQRAALEALEARLPSTNSFIELAEAGLARQERLMEAQATNQVALDEARNSLISARSGLIQLESQIESQKAVVASEEAKLNFSTIFAPVSGVVVSVDITEGQTLNAAQTTPVLLQIADLSRMTVEAQVAEANVGKLSVGSGVSFNTLGGGSRSWRGVLQRIVPRASENSSVVSYTAVFEVDNADGALLPGMTAQVFFELSEPREVLAVPVSMLREFGDSLPGGARTARVRLLSDGGGIEVREITVGEIGSTHAEVLEGLKEGDRVVSPGSQQSE